MHPAAPTARAFTLVELLVVIAVVGVIVGLAVPALRGARARATEGLVLSNLHGLGATLAQYHQAYSGWNPWVEPLTPLRTRPPQDGDGDTIATDDPWVLTYAWPTLLHETAPWYEHYSTWVDPPRNREGPRPWLTSNGVVAWPSYVCGRSLFARPAAWSAGSDSMRKELTRPTRMSEIVFPSSKAVAFDDDLSYLRRERRATDRRGVLSGDGSAAMRLDSSARPPVQNRISTHPPTVYHDTLDGVRGVDY